MAGVDSKAGECKFRCFLWFAAARRNLFSFIFPCRIDTRNGYAKSKDSEEKTRHRRPWYLRREIAYLFLHQVSKSEEERHANHRDEHERQDGIAQSFKKQHGAQLPSRHPDIFHDAKGFFPIQNVYQKDADIIEYRDDQKRAANHTHD